MDLEKAALAENRRVSLVIPANEKGLKKIVKMDVDIFAIPRTTSCCEKKGYNCKERTTV
ncbi:MAG: hypothetical protein AAB089_07920 [Nitrospirota bacterium]